MNGDTDSIEQTGSSRIKVLSLALGEADVKRQQL
jgi:hypothetical protein